MLRILSFLFAVLFSGCSVLNIFQGSFNGKDWEIEKIVVQGKEYDALRVMKDKALAVLKTKNEAIKTQEEGEEAQSLVEGGEQDLQSLIEDEKQEELSLNDLQELAQLDEISTLSFDTEQNKIYGNAGCNNFSADYVWKDADNIEIYEVNITRKLCTPSLVMTFELRFARNLKGVFFVEKQDKTSMVLKNKKVQIYLKSK